MERRRAIGRANAALIAAAPELLGTLEAILENNAASLPIELAERAEDVLNALKGRTDE